MSKITRRLIVVFGLCLVWSFEVLAEPAKYVGPVTGRGDIGMPEVPEGPFLSGKNHYNYRGDRVKFLHRIVETRNWQSKRELSALAKGMLDRSAKSHIRDDKWYWASLSETRNEVLLLVWWNMDERKYGWVAIKNTPERFLVRSNSSQGWVTPDEGGDKEYYQWTINGKKLDIDVRNPKNERNSWTRYDIWYSFGYPS
jgi:hypothetical protein